MHHRIERINELLTQEISQLIHEDSEELGMISILVVQTSRDLSQALIWYTPIANQKSEFLQHELDQRAPQYQYRLLKRLQLRRIPKLIFKIDLNQTDYLHVENLIEQVSKSVNEEKTKQ